jgi:hypothetical protein
MELGQLLPCRTHLHIPYVAAKRFHETPWNRVFGNLAMSQPLQTVNEPRKASPSHETAKARVGRNDTKLAVALCQFDVIDTNDLGSMDVDDLLVQNMVEQKHGRIFQPEVGLQLSVR